MSQVFLILSQGKILNSFKTADFSLKLLDKIFVTHYKKHENYIINSKKHTIMEITIIGTICALVLGKVAYDIEKNQDTTIMQLISLYVLLFAVGIFGGLSGLNTQINWADWIRFFCGAFGMFMPVYAAYALIKAKDKKEHVKGTIIILLLFIAACIAIYMLGYCGFSGLLYTFAGLAILGIATVVEVIGTFGILLGIIIKKSRG